MTECRHMWTDWSVFYPVRRPVSLCAAAAPPIKPSAIEAYRFRECQICGAYEAENDEGHRVDFWDARDRLRQ